MSFHLTLWRYINVIIIIIIIIIISSKLDSYDFANVSVVQHTRLVFDLSNILHVGLIISKMWFKAAARRRGDLVN